MSTTSNRTEENNGTAFTWDCGDDWNRLGTDLSRLCQRIVEQVTATIAGIDFEGIGREIRDAMREAGEELRRNMEAWSDASRAPDMAARADTATGPAAETSQPEAGATSQERMTVLSLVAQGRITAEEGARLLEALGT